MIPKLRVPPKAEDPNDGEKYVPSEILSKFLYVSGLKALDGDLAALGITHIVNCGTTRTLENFEYLSLVFPDDPIFDIQCILYDVLDFVETAYAAGGRVLIHCRRGISRSCALAIAYIMWRQKISYHEAFQVVKLCRKDCDPNAGFASQLISWSHAKSQIFRAAYLGGMVVPKLCRDSDTYCPAVPSFELLDPRTSFVVVLDPEIWVWIGSSCPDPLEEAAFRYAARRAAYDHREDPILVRDGVEPDAFWACLRGGSGDVVPRPAYDLEVVTSPSSPPDLLLLLLETPVVASSSSSAHDDDEATAIVPTVEESPVVNPQEESTHLYEYQDGSWDRVFDYDHEDLVSDGVVLLVPDQDRRAALGHDGVLWIGSAFQGDVDTLVLPQSLLTTNAPPRFLTVRQGMESSDFWQTFEAGF